MKKSDKEKFELLKSTVSKTASLVVDVLNNGAQMLRLSMGKIEPPEAATFFTNTLSLVMANTLHSMVEDEQYELFLEFFKKRILHFLANADKEDEETSTSTQIH